MAEPLVLSYADSKTLGIAETICACGMLVSGIILGVRGIKGHYVKTLGVSLILAGVFMFWFGMYENVILICIFGFLFFAALPFANNCLDFLVRTAIPDDVQGRAWGLIGFLSQMGYVVAYAISGVAADLLGNVTGLGVGRGAAIVVRAAGICLVITALGFFTIKSIKEMDDPITQV